VSGEPSSIIEVPPLITARQATLKERLAVFPWWFVAIIFIAIVTAYFILTRDNFRQAFDFIIAGISITIYTAIVSYAIALVIGLFAGLGRISRNVFIKNLASLYVELVRGIPMLVLIFYTAFVGIPGIIRGLNAVGAFFGDLGVEQVHRFLTSFNTASVPLHVSAIVALSITYGAFLAEIFRAGIQSIEYGQMEAARSQGMSYGQAMRYVILPQAIRNVLPALGNDFVAMVKDTSLVSVLAVRDITQIARLYAGRSFRFSEAYTILAVLYLTMTLVLSLVVRQLERRLRSNDR
jgi:polar amino acid transport system permease protein